ncbi:MAG: extracellular solute-binding protein, partial [Anaerolineaceae bacterium]|nr:extracellular solute-binding protein [Anaerolineaceae bacterium]
MNKFLSFLMILILSGCDVLGSIRLPAGFPLAVTATAVVDETPLPSGPTATIEQRQVTPTPTQVQVLTLWVPPDFDPASGTPAGLLLAERLREFTLQSGGVRVNVRVKAISGQGGLLESLSAASGAAPQALPSVIALPRADLEVAAIKGLVAPLDGISTVIDQPDWYDYARQLAMVQGTTFALPFAGDALVVAYRPARVVAPPADWDTVLRLGQPLAFPAGDGQALFVLALYQSIGGTVEDAQRRPTLQPEILSKVLQALADGEARGIFPSWLAQYETNAQVWQSYRDLRVNALVTWVSSYLSVLPPDTSAVPMPALVDTPLTLATGWGWAVADPVPERRELSIRLAEFLTEGSFMAKWTEAAGFLPTRPSAMAAWTNQSLKTLLSPV